MLIGVCAVSPKYLEVTVIIRFEDEGVARWPPRGNSILSQIGGRPKQQGSVRVYRVDFPICSPVRGEYDPLLSVVDSQVGPSFVVIVFIVLLAVGEIQGIGAVGVSNVYVPITVAVAGKCDTAAIRRPCRIHISFGVAGYVDRSTVGNISAGQSLHINLCVAVSVRNEGHPIPCTVYGR